jgi:hypothetical protein
MTDRAGRVLAHPVAGVQWCNGSARWTGEASEVEERNHLFADFAATVVLEE